MVEVKGEREGEGVGEGRGKGGGGEITGNNSSQKFNVNIIVKVRKGFTGKFK